MCFTITISVTFSSGSQTVMFKSPVDLIKINAPVPPQAYYYLRIQSSNICNLHNISNAYVSLRTQEETLLAP